MSNNTKEKRLYQLVPVHDIAEKGQTIPGYSGKLGAPVKRNALCPCSSGKKFKNCHGKRS